jgi:hypothetical protein
MTGKMTLSIGNSCAVYLKIGNIVHIFVNKKTQRHKSTKLKISTNKENCLLTVKNMRLYGES